MSVRANAMALNLERIIGNGAKVKQDNPKTGCTYINLRIPSEMLAQIDQEVQNSVGISRTGWILQALQKGLKNG